jgi:hypothetical protein
VFVIVKMAVRAKRELHDHSAVDRQYLAGNVARCRPHEKPRNARNIVDFPKSSQRDLSLERLDL